MDFVIPENQPEINPKNNIESSPDNQSQIPSSFNPITKNQEATNVSQGDIKPTRSIFKIIFNFLLITIITILIAVLIILLGVLFIPSIKESAFYFILDKIANSYQVENIPLLDGNRDLTSLNEAIQRINNSPSLFENLTIGEKDFNYFLENKISLVNGEIVETRVAFDTKIIHIFIKYKNHNSPWVQLDFNIESNSLLFKEAIWGNNSYSKDDLEKLLKFLPLGIDNIDTELLTKQTAKIILGSSTKFKITKISSTYQKLSLTFEKPIE